MPGWVNTEEKTARYAQPSGMIACLHLTYADGTEQEISLKNNSSNYLKK